METPRIRTSFLNNSSTQHTARIVNDNATSETFISNDNQPLHGLPSTILEKEEQNMGKLLYKQD